MDNARSACLGACAWTVAVSLLLGGCTGSDRGDGSGSGPGTGSATPPAAGGTPSAQPALDPAAFTHPKDNPYFPLTPGLVTRLSGSDEDGHYRERVEVTGRTKTILGVRAQVLSDVVRRIDGTLAEKTQDWYAADDDGNVWYFGEDTATYDEDGKLEDTEGSWLSGKDGARPGLIMPARPGPGQAYRQEFLSGEAEDQAWIVSRDEEVRVGSRTYRHVVRSYEWSRLEPGVLSLKYYAPGVGIVKEQDVAGGDEQFTLVSATPGG